MLDKERAVKADVEQDLLTLVVKDCISDGVGVFSLPCIEKAVPVDDDPAVLDGLAYPSEALRMRDGGISRFVEYMLPPPPAEERMGLNGPDGEACCDKEDEACSRKESDLVLECLRCVDGLSSDGGG